MSEPIQILIGTAFFIAVVWFRLRRWKWPGSSSLEEADFVVTVSEEGIGCQAPSGEKQEVRWADLTQVIIRTNDQGPLQTNLHWVLTGSRENPSYVVVPGGATGEQQLIEALGKLPGFDNDAFFAAMGSTKNWQFVCWTKSSP